MNSVSSSLSVYHGPPVISTEGCRWKSMYIFRVGCCVDQKNKKKQVHKPIGIGILASAYLDGLDGLDELFLHE